MRPPTAIFRLRRRFCEPRAASGVVLTRAASGNLEGVVRSGYFDWRALDPTGKSLHGLSLPLGRSLGLLKSLGGGPKIPTAPCYVRMNLDILKR